MSSNKKKSIITSRQTHVFVTTKNCYIAGGVEAILRNNGGQASFIAAKSSSDDFSSGTSLTSATDSSSSSFFQPSQKVFSAATKKINASNFMQTFKSSTMNLESQIRGMAIRAASHESNNKPTDSTAAIIYHTPNGIDGLEEIASTEFKPMTSTLNETYCIPCVIQEYIRQRGGFLQVRIVIRSDAQVLGLKQYRQYIIATANFALKDIVNKYTHVHATASSNIVTNSTIALTIIPDASSPQAFHMGWNITNPNVFQDQIFNLNLVKPYHFGNLLAVERTIESTLTLPISAAITELLLESAKISAKHCICTANKVKAHNMMFNDSLEAMKQGNADVCLQIYRYLKFSNNTEFQGQIPLRVQFQSPMDIFEREIGVGDMIMYTVPMGAASDNLPAQNQPCITIPFFPQLRELNHTKMVGKLRFEIAASPAPSGDLLDLDFGNSAHAAPSFNSIAEGILDLDPFLNNDTQNMVNVPIFSNGNQVGLLSVLVAARTISNLVDDFFANDSAPATVSDKYTYADGGLFELLSAPSCPIMTNSVLDRTTSQDLLLNPTNANTDAARRQKQLSTMGFFLDPSWIWGHAKYRTESVQELEYRTNLYKNAISKSNETTLDPYLRKNPSCFRPSSSKSEQNLSSIPFNVHVQSLTIEKLVPTREEVAVFSNVTCGAPADHARGFTVTSQPLTSHIPSKPAGGLLKWEQIRNELAQSVVSTKSELIQAVMGYFQLNPNKSRHIPLSAANVQHIKNKVIQEEKKLAELNWEISLRRANVFSQALGIAITSYLSTLTKDKNQITSSQTDTWIKHGFLLCFEGLLSTAGKETGMIEDAAVAISMLNRVGVTLVSSEQQKQQVDLLSFDLPTTQPEEKVSKRRVFIHASEFVQWIEIFTTDSTDLKFIVKIGVMEHYFNYYIPNTLKSVVVPFYSTLFQMGVDIRQWGANAGNNFKNQLLDNKNKLERQISREPEEQDDDDNKDDPSTSAENCDFLMKLNQNAFKRLNSYAYMTVPISSSHGKRASITVHPILTLLAQYLEVSHGKMEHGVLDACAQSALKLGGGSIIFCKSGKDRTAMQVTYKQAQFLQKFICSDNNEVDKNNFNEDMKQTIIHDATLMRLHGTRLMVCEKNVGQPKYAFNSLQAKFMPETLKPPLSECAGFLKGGRVFSKEGFIES